MWAAGLITLIARSGVPRNIDPDQPLRYFSWLRFSIVAAIYTALVFWLADKPFRFSGRGAPWRRQVLLVHAMFLVALLCCFRLCTYVVLSLPFWMTDRGIGIRGTRASFIECVLYFGAFGMALFERWWLYRESETTFSSSEDS